MSQVKIVYVGGEMMESKFMCLAPYQLTACLLARGIAANVHEVTPINYEEPDHLDALLECDVVGFSCNSFTYAFLLPVLREIKRVAPHIVTVIGGVHALHQAADILKETPVDYVISGEGDESFPLLVERVRAQESVAEVPGITMRARLGGVVTKPQLRKVLAENLPVPSYDLLKSTPRILVFETSRGCPFRCTFCSIDLNSKWTPWTPEIVVARFEETYRRLRDPDALRTVMFADDNFATDSNRAAEILRQLNHRFPKVNFSFETRAREVLKNSSPLEVCAERGIRSSFLFGIECGYDAGLARINKKLTVDEVRRSAALVHSLGMHHGAVFSYIIGFPWETRKERMATLRLAEELYERYEVKSTVFYWLPIPSQMCNEFNIRRDYTEPFWWRRVQAEMNEIVDDEEAALMEKVNANGNFSDTRIDETARPDRSVKNDRSPRHLPAREQSAQGV